jgi:L-malate glycosyltransferase
MVRVLFILNQKEGFGGIKIQVDNLKKNLDLISEYQTDIYGTKGNLIKRVWNFFYLFIIGQKYDVFHIHGCSYWGFVPIVYGVTAGKLLRKKIIITYHGGDAANFFKMNPSFTRFFLKKADHLIVLSGYLKSVFNKHGYSVKLIPNIIETSISAFIKREVINPRFISIRSLEPLYNIRLIIDAFHTIQKKYSDASLLILGDGSMKNILLDYVQQNDIKNILFTGHVSNDEIYSYLARADIMINASLIDNMPVSLLEAFSSGVLVVSSNVGGVPYMLENNDSGLLFESNNREDLISKLFYALENQGKSKEMITNAHNQMAKYSWQEIKYEILNLYSQ